MLDGLPPLTEREVRTYAGLFWDFLHLPDLRPGLAACHPFLNQAHGARPGLDQRHAGEHAVLFILARHCL